MSTTAKGRGPNPRTKPRTEKKAGNMGHPHTPYGRPHNPENRPPGWRKLRASLRADARADNKRIGGGTTYQKIQAREWVADAREKGQL